MTSNLTTINSIKNNIRSNFFLWSLYEFTRQIYFAFHEFKFLIKHGSRYREITKYLHIIGWLTENEAKELYNLTSKLPKNRTKIVEIGSWLGKSSFLLAKGLKKHTRKSVLVCIDPFDSADDKTTQSIYKDISSQLKESENASLKEKFIDNMRKFGVIDIITILDGYSFEVVKKFNQRIDLLFIDGNHEFKAVKKDFLDWSKFIKNGGFVAFHDVDFDPFKDPSGKEINIGPGMVIKKHIIGSPVWTEFCQVDGLFYARKIK